MESIPSYDLCILGCGPSGFAGAMRAIDAGGRVCIVERDEIGGAGVMWGALASKTMWELAKDYSIARNIERGYRSASLIVNYSEVRRTVLQAVKEKQYQMLSQLESFSPRCWKGHGSVTLKRGKARLLDARTVQIMHPDRQPETIRARNLLIATGSRPRAFPGVVTDQQRILDSDGVLNLTQFPRRLMIIGAGIIGCEYATIFSNFAQTKVYLVDHQERTIPYEDEDVSHFVNKSLVTNGVEIFHSAKLTDIRHRDNYLEVVLDFASGYAKVVEVDAVLIAIGREPALDGLDLQAAGIVTDARGYLPTDEHSRVTANIYGAGDVIAHPALVNLAEMESRYAVEHMFGLPRRKINYSNMSTVMFFNPAVAAVGMSERQCRANRIPYRVAYYSNSLLSRAIAMRALSGFVKIIISDEKHPRILGMRAAGPQVSSTIMSIALLIGQDKTIEDVLDSIYPHPTMSEGIQECLRLLVDSSVYKPRAFPDRLIIRSWQPLTQKAGNHANDPK